MPTERKLLPRDIRFVLAWADKWRAIPTRKQIARQMGVAEATIRRIVKNNGYIPRKAPRDIEALISSSDLKRPVPRGTDLKGPHQGEVCTPNQL